jgi:hypothetical protein
MYEHNHPQLNNITYLEYIQSYGGPGRLAFTSPFIEPRGAYSISFMPKNKDGQTAWGSITKIVAGSVIVIGVVVGTACVIASAGTCAAALTPIAAVVGQEAALTAGVAATQVVTAAGVTGTVVTAGAAGGAIYSGVNNIMAKLYSERDMSMIIFGPLSLAQDKCGSGDVAGQ